jgi:hypothetical protein
VKPLPAQSAGFFIRCELRLGSAARRGAFRCAGLRCTYPLREKSEQPLRVRLAASRPSANAKPASGRMSSGWAARRGAAQLMHEAALGWIGLACATHAPGPTQTERACGHAAPPSLPLQFCFSYKKNSRSTYAGTCAGQLQAQVPRAPAYLQPAPHLSVFLNDE